MTEGGPKGLNISSGVGPAEMTGEEEEEAMGNESMSRTMGEPRWDTSSPGGIRTGSSMATSGMAGEVDAEGAEGGGVASVEVERNSFRISAALFLAVGRAGRGCGDALGATMGRTNCG